MLGRRILDMVFLQREVPSIDHRSPYQLHPQHLRIAQIAARFADPGLRSKPRSTRAMDGRPIQGSQEWIRRLSDLGLSGAIRVDR